MVEKIIGIIADVGAFFRLDRKAHVVGMRDVLLHCTVSG